MPHGSALTPPSAANAGARPRSAESPGLSVAHEAPVRSGEGWRLGGWEGRVSGGALEVTGSGTPEEWWRVVAAAAWDHLDRAGAPVDLDRVVVPAR